MRTLVQLDCAIDPVHKFVAIIKSIATIADPFMVVAAIACCRICIFNSSKSSVMVKQPTAKVL